MRLDINKLPKKLNEVNYFKKVDNGCEIYSYNLDYSKRDEVIVIELEDFEIEKDFCIDVKAMNMIKALHPADIKITDKSFIINSANGRFTSKLLNEALFDLSTDDMSNEIVVDIDTITKASNYASKDNSKLTLNGVRVDDNGNIYATDAFRAYFNLKNRIVASGITLPINFIKSIKELINNKNINIKYNNYVVMSKENNISVYSKLIDGNYPDMSKIMQNKAKTQQIEVDKEELIEKIGIALNVGANLEKKIVLKLKTNLLQVVGDNEYEANIKFINGTTLPLNLQLDYLDQALKSINGEINFDASYNDVCGTMAFISNVENNEIVLLLGIRE